MNEPARPRNVAILIFDDVEVLDFCGPFEVFAVTGRKSAAPPFHVYTVAERALPVSARNQLMVIPRHTLADCPTPEILVVPGGWGTRRELNNQPLLAWIADVSRAAELTLSVCTGALLLAKAGLLDGLTATTHHGAIEELREVAPHTRIDPGRRYVDNGRVILSAGVAAGMDMSLAVVARLLGPETAAETARYIEYPWPRNE
jgi:transcriptional regulator GlxA family with amidase domain